jgi:NADH-quinone oxidoreductase E subunit
MTSNAHSANIGGEHFEFTQENHALAAKAIAKYPAGRQASAVLPLLYLAQRQSGGWLPRSAMDCVASILSMAPVRVYEVASFYTMFNLKPVGKHLVQVCGTTPCWLRGAEGLVKSCQSHLGIDVGETSEDGQFTLLEVECLGACANAPMVQINDDYYEDLSPDRLKVLLDDLKKGKPVKCGSQVGRIASEPESHEYDASATTQGEK